MLKRIMDLLDMVASALPYLSAILLFLYFARNKTNYEYAFASFVCIPSTVIIRIILFIYSLPYYHKQQ